MFSLNPPTRSALAAAMPHLASLGAGDGSPILLAAVGPAAAVQGQVEAFRGLLGPVGPAWGLRGGRRELPGGSSPAGWTAAVEGRARGLVMGELALDGSTVELEVVADDDGPARTRGFGALFGDVGPADSIGVTFFDGHGRPLGAFFVPAASGPGAQAFLGVYFGASLVARIRISGLAPDGHRAGGGGAALAGLILGEPVSIGVGPIGVGPIGVGPVGVEMAPAWAGRAGHGDAAARPAQPSIG